MHTNRRLRFFFAHKWTCEKKKCENQIQNENIKLCSYTEHDYEWGKWQIGRWKTLKWRKFFIRKQCSTPMAMHDTKHYLYAIEHKCHFFYHIRLVGSVGRFVLFGFIRIWDNKPLVWFKNNKNYIQTITIEWNSNSISISISFSIQTTKTPLIEPNTCFFLYLIFDVGACAIRFCRTK